MSSTPLQGSQKLLRSSDASAAGNVPSPQISFPPMDIKTMPVQTSLSHPSTSFSPLPPCTPPPSPRTSTSHLYRRISDSSVVHVLSSSGAPNYPSPPQQLAAMSTHAPSYPAIPSYPQSCPPSVQENLASHHRRGPSGSSLQGVPAVPLSPVPGTTTFHMYTPTFTTHTPHHPTFPPMSPSTHTSGQNLPTLPTPTSKPPTGTRPWARSHYRSQSATTLPHIRIDLSQTNFNTNTLRASNTYTTQTHSGCLSSTTQKDLFLPNRYQRPGGHSRSSSLGNVTQRPTHSRNRSLGSIPWSSHSLSRPLVTRNDSLGNLSNASTETAFSTTSGRLFDNQPSQEPNPQEGYDFSRHFNLFSQFTSNMALQYCTQTSEDVPQCKAPAVWCMDVGNKVIAVGCGNGQVEVGVALVPPLQGGCSLLRLLSFSPLSYICGYIVLSWQHTLRGTKASVVHVLVDRHWWCNGQHCCLPSSRSGFDSRPMHNFFFPLLFPIYYWRIHHSPSQCKFFSLP